ncbi:MAG TPA: hypothetical protein VKB49_08040 [Candidatus Sulfotelmatobacter sp.]|nr:hypothetical protein [Candidatus Sulfotelmatobacter sp.]
MGIGHVALALGASKAEPRLNVGWLVFAALLSDFLLGVFAAFGVEHATVPADFTNRHYLLFTFPYSHGLLALIVWSTIFGFLVSRVLGFRGQRVWLLVGLVALSHFLLDGLVHVAGLPLVGENSPKLGLGLWNHMPLELSIETLMAVMGLVIYWKITGAAGSGLSRYGIAIFVIVMTALTWTQLLPNPAPTARELTITWIVAPIVLSAIAYALDRRRVVQAFSSDVEVSNP